MNDPLRDMEVARHSAQDAANAARQPSTIPEAWKAEEFVEPKLPKDPFTIRMINTGEELGPFRPEDFQFDPYPIMSAHVIGTGEPVILRLIHQSNHILHCIDSNADGYMCVLHPMPDTALEIEES